MRGSVGYILIKLITPTLRNISHWMTLYDRVTRVVAPKSLVEQGVQMTFLLQESLSHILESMQDSNYLPCTMSRWLWPPQRSPYCCTFHSIPGRDHCIGAWLTQTSRENLSHKLSKARIKRYTIKNVAYMYISHCALQM